MCQLAQMLWWDHVAERQANNLLNQHLYVSDHDVGAADLVHGRQNVEAMCIVYMRCLYVTSEQKRKYARA